MIRVPYERLVAEMQKVLVKKGYTEERAEMVAKIFADNSLAGVPTHGFNRFARADLEHALLMVDDDMKTEGLPQTNYLKSIITAELPMDLEEYYIDFM